MKYSVYAQRRDRPDKSVGHATAASALEDLTALNGAGALQIQVFEIRTGRLIDEAALRRADAQDRQMAARLPPIPAA